MNKLPIEKRAQILGMMVEGMSIRSIARLHYNFVRIHQTTRVTPAMAAGVSQTLWSLADIVRVVNEWEAVRN